MSFYTWKTVTVPVPNVARPSLSTLLMGGVLAFLVLDKVGCDMPIPIPTPAPVPVPDPEPPKPAPITSPLVLAYCLDAARQTPAEAAIATDPTLRAELTRLGVILRVFQSNETDIDAKNLQGFAAMVGYPFALLYRFDTSERVELLAKPTVADILAAVKKARGEL